MEPGSKFRNVMPPFFGTPGDGRGKRQGTSLLSRAGENTGCIGILGQEVASATFFSCAHFPLTSPRPIGYNITNGFDGKSTAPEAQSELRLVQGSR